MVRVLQVSSSAKRSEDKNESNPERINFIDFIEGLIRQLHRGSFKEATLLFDLRFRKRKLDGRRYSPILQVIGEKLLTAMSAHLILGLEKVPRVWLFAN